MGIFDAIKKNVTQGGVDVEIYTQPVVSKNSAHAVIVRVIAKESAAQIKHLSVRLEQLDQQQSSMFGSSYRSSQRRSQPRTIAQVDSTQSFALAQGEVRDVQLVLNIRDDNGGNGLFGQLGSAINKVTDFMNRGQNMYNIVAVADVEGVAIDPSGRMSVQLVDGGAVPSIAQTPAQQPSPQQQVQPDMPPTQPPTQ